MESQTYYTTIKYEAFEETLKEMSSASESNKVIGVFCGDIDPETGKSWCPDCVDAEPFIVKTVPAECQEGKIPMFWCKVDRPT